MSHTGKRKQKVFQKITECRKWLGDARYQDKHSNPNFPQDMTIAAWFEYWIDIKKKLVRPNTSRNYTERYYANIEPVIGNMIITEVTTIHCQ